MLRVGRILGSESHIPGLRGRVASLLSSASSPSCYSSSASASLFSVQLSNTVSNQVAPGAFGALAKRFRKDKLSYGTGSSSSKMSSKIHPMPDWWEGFKAHSGATKAQIADLYKTVQFFGGKDPTEFLELQLEDIAEAEVESRTFYVPDSVRTEMFNLYLSDPEKYNTSQLAIQFKLAVPTVETILVLKLREIKYLIERGITSTVENMDTGIGITEYELDEMLEEFLVQNASHESMDIFQLNRLQDTPNAKPVAISALPETNLKALAKMTRKNFRKKGWRDQLPHSFSPIANEELYPSNKEEDTPLMEPIPPRQEETSDKKRIIRKFGHIFQTIEDGVARPSTPSEMVEYQEKHIGSPKRPYAIELQPSGPLPEESRYDALYDKDEIHLANYFNSIASEWAPSAESPIPSSELQYLNRKNYIQTSRESLSELKNLLQDEEFYDYYQDVIVNGGEEAFGEAEGEEDEYELDERDEFDELEEFDEVDEPKELEELENFDLEEEPHRKGKKTKVSPLIETKKRIFRARNVLEKARDVNIKKAIKAKRAERDVDDFDDEELEEEFENEFEQDEYEENERKN